MANKKNSISKCNNRKVDVSIKKCNRTKKNGKSKSSTNEKNTREKKKELIRPTQA